MGGGALFVTNKAASVPTPSNTLAVGTPKGIDPNPKLNEESMPEAGGMFNVKAQQQQQPVIQIADSSPFNLRLVMTDSQGRTRTEWFTAGTDRSIEIPQGDYEAVIDAPDDQLNRPTNGIIRVKDFHHYDANFVLGSSRSPEFYIGD
jgi:hypothetical protein